MLVLLFELRFKSFCEQAKLSAIDRIKRVKMIKIDKYFIFLGEI